MKLPKNLSTTKYLSSARNRLGSASLIVAVLALVAALAGGAIADSGGKSDATASKSKKGPRGPKGAKGAKGAKGDTGSAGPVGPAGPAGPAGPVGPPGPEGPAGLAGATGKTGDTGKIGNTGKTGDTGKTGNTGNTGDPWAVGGNLPTGATLTGVWGEGEEGVIEGSLRSEAVSFSLPLIAAPAFVYVKEGEASKPGCPGIVAGVPKANSGNFCVYAVIESINSPPDIVPPTVSATNPLLGGAPGTSKEGAFLQTLCIGAPLCQGIGVWAVTG